MWRNKLICFLHLYYPWRFMKISEEYLKRLKQHIHFEPSNVQKQSWRRSRPEVLKKRLWHRCFPVNFVKFQWTPFSQNTSGRLLLDSSGRNNEACVIIVTKSTTFEFKMKKWKKKMNQKFVTAKMFRKLKTFDNNIKYTFLFWI